MKTGIIELYYSFLGYLGSEKEKIAPLQLTSKIEDYLVKEFVYHIYKESGGKVFALTNLGKRGERKIDICLLKGNPNNPLIYGMIEAKYLRNKHRLSDNNATDEIYSSLKSLSKQIGPFNGLKHGDYDVKLSAKSKHIYGLVFASYVKKEGDMDRKDEFYNKILKKAEKLGFRYHDLKKPYFRHIFEDVSVDVLNTQYCITLKAGLWKLEEKDVVK